MEPRTGAQGAFAVKAFYKNGDILVIAQREFRRYFGIHPELSSKFTLSDHKTVTVFVKPFHNKSTLCSSPRLHCN